MQAEDKLKLAQSFEAKIDWLEKLTSIMYEYLKKSGFGSSAEFAKAIADLELAQAKYYELILKLDVL